MARLIGVHFCDECGHILPHDHGPDGDCQGCVDERPCPVCEGPMTEAAAPEGWCAECEAIAEA